MSCLPVVGVVVNIKCKYRQVWHVLNGQEKSLLHDVRRKVRVSHKRLVRGFDHFVPMIPGFRDPAIRGNEVIILLG